MLGPFTPHVRQTSSASPPGARPRAVTSEERRGRKGGRRWDGVVGGWGGVARDSRPAVDVMYE